MIFQSIKQIIVNQGSITIGDDGIVLGASEATNKNGVLVIGDASSSSNNTVIVGNGFSSSIVSGGSISIGNGSGGTVLRGPRSTPITINGIKTTYGEIMDRHSGQTATPADAALPPPVYQLDESCCIDRIQCNGGTAISSTAKWLSKSLAISIRGSGDVFLPATEFTDVGISIAGSGEVHASNASTSTTSINISGSGEVNGLHVLRSGNVSIAGSGEVDITAVDPNRVARSVAGSGEINVGKQGSKKRRVE